MVNGRAAEVDIEPGDSLLDVLRERLRLTGAKEACGRGECGACTVLIDGTPIMSCVTLAALVHGEVATIEGLADESRDLREAFADAGAFQCGYCTPGFVLMVHQLLKQHPDPSDEDIRHYLSGNLCRCAAYPEIIEAVKLAARR